jgi:serine protease Do
MSQVASHYATLRASVVGLGEGSRRGCGVVVAPDRVVALARSLGADRVPVRLRDGRSRPGEVLGVDRGAGVAVLDVPTDGAPPARWATEAPGVGATVFALGDPGGTGLRVTEGRVSAGPLTIRGRHGRGVEVIEHTAPMPRGAGGGPLVDEAGAVLGLNALRGDPGFLLALPAAVVRPAVERVLSGAPEPRRLGVALAPPRASRKMRRAVGLPDREGLLVREVEDGSPAHRAGVLPGDLLVRLGDAELRTVDDLFAELDLRTDAGSVGARVVRGVEERDLVLPLAGDEG